MTLISDQINEIKRRMYGTFRAELNLLAASIDNSQTTVTFADELRGINTGAIVSVDDELMFVRSATSSSKQATVVRGFMGSVAASHTIDALVDVNPRFPTIDIRDAIKDEIRSWPASLFAVGATSIAGAYNVRGYDLGSISPFYDVLDVRRSPNVGSSRQDILLLSTALGFTWPRVNRWEVVRSMPTSSFASGIALFIPQFQDTATIQVIYSKPFDTSNMADSRDLEADLGLSSSMLDIVVLGALWRLVTPREIKRSFTEQQGDSRSAAEVPAGDSLNTGRGMKALRDARIEEEAYKLRMQYPPVGF